MHIEIYAELRSNEPLDPREVEQVVTDWAKSKTARVTRAGIDSIERRNGVGMVVAAPIAEYVYSLEVIYE